MVLFLRAVEMLIFCLGVEETYCLAAVWGFGMPPPRMFTWVVLMLDCLWFWIEALLEGGFKVEFLLLLLIIELFTIIV